MNRILRAFEVWLAEQDTPRADADDVVFPRDPIVPVFEVGEVRYDLDCATMTGLLAAGRERLDFRDVYEGLTDREVELLCDARCALVRWRERLGG